MFRLNIECTRDIDELHINFSDGTSTVVGAEDLPPKKAPENTGSETTGSQDSLHTDNAEVRGGTRPQEGFLDLDADFGGVSQDVVKPPEIERVDRGVKVADELQNFDF